ncbi:MAG: dynamin family protein [Dehalococcoidia bacterium]|nr:dynamin family protein [Dehalococcoidia bacterium]
MTPTLIGRVDAACTRAMDELGDNIIADDIRRIREGLHQPLRVAIVGRIKAGKSTLLNALLGERIAATDAGECTRYVCHYRHGLSYEVEAVMPGGARVSLPFRRGEDTLEIGLEAAPGGIDRLEVAWPSSALARMTIIDTPGMGSTSEEVRVRIASFLGGEDERFAPEADAVVFLMRHLHRTDLELMESLYDQSVVSASPVNAVAVLSRADEVCAARPDAMEAARRIADRYAADPQLRGAVADVIPMAGLLAETGATLRESEVAWLRQLAEMDKAELPALLLSVDRFRQAELGPLTGEVREILLRRLGLFGVRFALQEISERRGETAVALARALIQVSGIARLQALIDEYFASRAGHLKARSALLQLRSAARSAEETSPGAARSIRTSIEMVEASAHELAELRLLHLALTGAAGLSEDEVAEIRRLVSGRPAAGRLDLPEDATKEAQGQAALERVERWRQRAANPLAPRDLMTACEIATRSYEGIYAGTLAE